MKEIKEISGILQNTDKLVVCCHINPDGDAIGSALAVYFYANQKKRDVRLIIPNELPYNLEFINKGGFAEIYEPEKHDGFIKDAGAICIVDLNDSDRLKSMEKAVLDSHAKKIVIDHHLDPKAFANHYYVDSEACSTGELAYKILKQDKDFKLTREIADALYLAIMTDTGNFRFPRTGPEVHRAVADLIEAGTEPWAIHDEVYNQSPPQSVRLLGEAYSGIEIYFGGKFCLMQIRHSAFEKAGANEGDIEGFSEKMMRVKGVMAGVLMSEIKERNEIRMSFRSKGDYPVNELAARFGGGGHKNASGARAQNIDFDTAKKQLLGMAEIFMAKHSESP